MAGGDYLVEEFRPRVNHPCRSPLRKRAAPAATWPPPQAPAEALCSPTGSSSPAGSGLGRARPTPATAGAVEPGIHGPSPLEQLLAGPALLGYPQFSDEKIALDVQLADGGRRLRPSWRALRRREAHRLRGERKDGAAPTGAAARRRGATAAAWAGAGRGLYAYRRAGRGAGTRGRAFSGFAVPMPRSSRYRPLPRSPAGGAKLPDGGELHSPRRFQAPWSP